MTQAQNDFFSIEKTEKQWKSNASIITLIYIK